MYKIIICIKDLKKERVTRKESKWKTVRRVSLERIGINKREIKRKREEGNQEIVNIILEKIWKRRKRKDKRK